MAQHARPLAATISFSLAVTNGFIWNNWWTFRYAGGSSVRGRYVKFVITNLIGLGCSRIFFVRHRFSLLVASTNALSKERVADSPFAHLSLQT